MATRTKIVPEDGIVYSFSRNMEPVHQIDLDEVVVVETFNALHGIVKRESGRKDELDLRQTNPGTGPIFVRGIYPGDMLGIEIIAIDVDSAGIGLSGDEYRVIQIEDCLVQFGSNIEIPIRPHIGVIGLAPETGSHSCKVPGEHGGNLDTKEVAPGSTIVLPAHVEGGLLALGDIHAVMADGEVNGAVKIP